MYMKTKAGSCFSCHKHCWILRVYVHFFPEWLMAATYSQWIVSSQTFILNSSVNSASVGPDLPL